MNVFVTKSAFFRMIHRPGPLSTTDSYTYDDHEFTTELPQKKNRFYWLTAFVHFVGTTLSTGILGIFLYALLCALVLSVNHYAMRL